MSEPIKAPQRRRKTAPATHVAESESPGARLARIRRTASADSADGDAGFLLAIIADLGAVAAHAAARLDQIAAVQEERGDGCAAAQARDASRAITLQSAYFGIWHRTEIERPTHLPNESVAVLFCTVRADHPKQGFYTTDEHGQGRWEIYSALQDHILDYRGPEPEIWAQAPAKPDPAIWPSFDRIPDEAFPRSGRDHIAALTTDLTQTGRGDLIATIAALPSLVRLFRDVDQIRSAHLRTAEALGVPATAYAPAEEAARLKASTLRLTLGALAPPACENENERIES